MSIGVLINNLGTPAAATPVAVGAYLREFLSDSRVVEIPKVLWWPLLNFLVAPLRAKQSAHAYQQIWLPEGSPLKVYSEKLMTKVVQKIAPVVQGQEVYIELGMTYGQPSVTDALRRLQQKKIERLIVLPLYPQYSSATQGACFDLISDELQQWRYVPELHFINHYHQHPLYIGALATKIENAWQQNGRGQCLIMSFHGLPKRNINLGDPYYEHCQETARLLAKKLSLNSNDYRVVFQSRFGRAEWLQPYCMQTLQELPSQAIKKIDVICPGFSVDCLETLEEIAIQNKKAFLAAGGEEFHYISCLNASEEHAQLLQQLIISYL